MFSWLKRKTKNAASVTIVPRVKHVDFIEEARRAIKAQGCPEGPELERNLPICEPLVGDLIVTFAIDVGPGFMFLDELKMEEHALDRTGLREHALTTIWPILSEGASIHDLENIKVVQAPDNLAACSIFFPSIWERLGSAYGEPVVAGFVHRDYVLFANGSDPDQVESLHRELTTAPPEEDNHNLSRLAYKFEAGEWSVYNPGTTH